MDVIERILLKEDWVIYAMIHEHIHVANLGTVKVVTRRHMWFSRELGGGKLSTEVSRHSDRF